MTNLVLRVLLFLALGFALGWAHAKAIAEGERIHRETGERARPTVIFVLRLVLLCVAFGLIGKSGSMPLLASLLGFVMARLVRRRTTKAPLN
ncbi:N-ATPase subunit AtpR [Polyangium jinanense]|uniref:ATP synthase subunit I n=1 Tax=Polyangium jinanense TaxID=2829994 RepID=A0A9X3X4X5_9BACT|nr:ATP synthase subunit I [Polyangium jinanense]MDC3958159.1 hypothetical protein [Polyangium jinanense]MDC3983642.1 hypothetical protein [Polyangium jinanense]